MKIINDKRGLVLAEAMIGVVTLITASIVVSSVIKNALETTALSRDYLIANNLANEVIQEVKAFRNSNWMVRPDDSDCWLVLTLGVSTVCDVAANPSIALSQGEEYAVVGEGGSASFVPLSAGANGLAVQAANGADQIVFDQLNLYQNEDSGELFALDDPSNIPADAAPSKYFRNLEVLEYDPIVNETATMKTTVQWTDRKKVRSLERTFVIYNYIDE